MKGKGYNLYFLLPDGRTPIRVHIPSLFLQLTALLLSFFVLFSIWIAYDYYHHIGQSIPLEEWINITNFQKNKLTAFRNKIKVIEKEISDLQNQELEIKRDWHAIKDLSKRKKMTPAPPIRKEMAFVQEEKIFILEEPFTDIVRRLHQDLVALRRITDLSSKKIFELKETLNLQKSILLATPSLWPVFGRITSPFGETRILMASGGTKPHKGVDIAAPLGTPILAAAPGVVIQRDFQPDYGNLIVIDHGHGYSTQYAHMQKIHVHVGKKVKKGEVIGTVGMSGFTNGPHLHYEIHIHGVKVNPQAYLTEIAEMES